ncbi:conserved repeat domain-containing protein [Paenibacillaceae bacterium GAS479]|nr:conserved repeat domain-containing protein [Paenibacillaceae bacterium GAS479]
MAGQTIYFQLLVTNSGDTTLTQIEVKDVLAPGGILLDITLDSLPPGVTNIQQIAYTIPDPPPAGFLNNILTANAPLSSLVAESNVFIDINDSVPGISISKSADHITAPPGEIIEYSLVVSNTGTTDLNSVVVSDPTLGFSATIDLSAGETTTQLVLYQVPFGTAAGTLITNTATATANGVTSQSSWTVTVSAEAEIFLEKSADVSTAVPGDIVQYTFTITNIGNLPLTGIVLTDSDIGVSIPISSLDVGMSVQPTVDFMIPFGTPAGTFTNNASVTSDQGAEASSSTGVMISPSASLIFMKTASETQASPGDAISYTFSFLNSGNITLTDVFLTDPTLGIAQSIETLLPGMSFGIEFLDEFTIPAGTLPGTQFTNTATVTTDQLAPIQSSATVTVQAAPSISLEKSVSPTTAFNGDTVTYTFIVTNTGNVPLTGIMLMDPTLGISLNIPDLDPGDSNTGMIPFVVPMDALVSIMNTATVTGDASGTIVQAQGTATLTVNPLFEFTKTVDQSNANPGDTVTFLITINYFGTEPIFVELDDELLDLHGIGFILSSGGIATDSSTFVIPNLPGGTVITNTATLTGSGVMEEASATVTVNSVPGISILKTADTASAAPGDTVTYTITVQNTGNVALPDVTVMDPLLRISTPPTPIAIGGSQVVTGTFTIPLGTPAGTIITNTATASSSLTIPVQSSASVSVLAAPVLAIVKIADRSSAAPGETILYTITVSNPSGGTINGIQLTDAVLGLSVVIGTLGPGDSINVPASFTVPAGTPAGTIITNTATATSPTTLPVSDSVSVTVAAGTSLSITKSVTPGSTSAGGIVIYTITVINTGNTVLTNTTVSDPTLSLSIPVGQLQPGQSRSQSIPFQLPFTLAPGSVFTNTATATSDQTPPVEASAEVFVLPPPQATVTVSPFPAFGLPGGEVTVTVTVTNPSSVTLTNLVLVNDFLGINITVPSLAPGGSFSIVRTVLIPAGTPAGTEFSSLAILNTDQTPTTAAQVLVIVQPAPVLALSKTVRAPEAVPGEKVRFKIQAVNTGNTVLTGVLTDPLLQLTIGPITLSPQNRFTLSVPFVIPPETLNGATITNTAFFEGSGVAQQASASVQVLRVLDVSKVSNKKESFLGDTIRYTILVENGSVFTAVDSVLQDVLAPSVALVPGSVTVNDVVQPDSSLRSGVKLGTIEPGQRVVVRFTVKNLSIPRSTGSSLTQSADPLSGVLLNQAVVTFHVLSPSGRNVEVQALSNISRVIVTEEEE